MMSLRWTTVVRRCSWWIDALSGHIGMFSRCCLCSASDAQTQSQVSRSYWSCSKESAWSTTRALTIFSQSTKSPSLWICKGRRINQSRSTSQILEGPRKRGLTLERTSSRRPGAKPRQSLCRSPTRTPIAHYNELCER